MTDRFKSNSLTANLNTTAAWVGGIVPTSADVAVFDSNYLAITDVGASMSWRGIRVTNVGPNPSSVFLSNTGANVTLTIGLDGLDLSNATKDLKFAYGSNSLATFISIPNASTPFNVAAGRTIEIATRLSGAGGFAKSGAGTLVLIGTNTYSGATVLAGGVTRVFPYNNSANTAGPFGTSPTITMSGGAILEYDGDPRAQPTDYSSKLRGNVDIDTGGITAVFVDEMVSSKLIKRGHGTLRLATFSAVSGHTAPVGLRANSYTGNTEVRGGVLEFTAGGVTPTYFNANPVIVNGGILRWLSNESSVAFSYSGGNFNTVSADITGRIRFEDNGHAWLDVTALDIASSATLGNNISGVASSSSITKLGSGFLDASFNNTGDLLLEEGTLRGTTGSGKFWLSSGVGYSGTVGGSLVFNGDFTCGAVTQASGTIELFRSVSVTVGTSTYLGVTPLASFGGSIVATSYGLTKLGGGPMTLSGTNAHAGGTTLSEGKLTLGNNAALGTGTLTIAAGTTLDALAAGFTVTNPFVVNGSFTFTGTGSLTQNTGIITLGNSSTITVSAGTFTLNGSISSTANSLTKVGTGTLVLGGSNVHTGGTVLTTGTLKTSSLTALGTGAVSVASGTILQLATAGGGRVVLGGKLTMTGGTIRVGG